MKSGLIDRVKASLDAAGVAHVELGGVVPNPHLSKVREGIALGKKEGIDFILAVGGGSTIDSSKAISYGLAEPEKDVWELFGKEAHCTEIPAHCIYPDGSAAGSETSNSCVITNEETKEKRSYNDDIAASEVCYYESGIDDDSAGLSDGIRMHGYYDAYYGEIFHAGWKYGDYG